jgi:hypothetical protein
MNGFGKTTLAGALAMAAFAALPREAHADDAGTEQRQKAFRSPQNFALEVRVGPYKPNIDDEPGLQRDAQGQLPFRSAFGTTPRIMVGLEFDWQALRIPHVGSIGPGLGVGYTAMSGDVTTLSGAPSGDETGLEIYPVYGVGVLRLDVLWRDLGIPLVPYGKFGVAAGFWRASNSGGTASAANVSGKGTTLGTQAAVGIMFALDALDPGAGRNMDNLLGINGTYLFAEYYSLGLTGLGQSKPLLVGSSTWTAGFAFEM